jgi:hypothetical protein
MMHIYFFTWSIKQFIAYECINRDPDSVRIKGHTQIGIIWEKNW